MADLSIEYAGLTLKNPLICASGPNADSVDMIKAAAKAGFAATVLKSMGYKRKRPTYARATPRYRVQNRMDYNLRWNPKDGLDNMGILTSGGGVSFWSDQYIDFINECKRAVGKEMLIGASALCSSTSPESYEEAIDTISQSEADFAEIDMGYMRFYKDPTFSVKVVELAKKKLSIPVTAKVAPFLTDPTETIRNYEKAGVDGLCLFDLYYMLDFDIDEMKLPFRGTFQTFTEGVTLPYTNRSIADARLEGIKVPISASFGVWYWQDVIKCIMSGADAVQTCRKVMVHGFDIATVWLKKVDDWLESKNYESLRELKGKILSQIVDFREIPKEIPLARGGKPSLIARVEEEQCTGCRLCVPPCLYFAMMFEDNRARVDPTKCEGCGACVGTCHVDAISLVPR